MKGGGINEIKKTKGIKMFNAIYQFVDGLQFIKFAYSIS
jgi:hypothetical protein